MSDSNITQILSRNIDLLDSTRPLLVNLTDNSIFSELNKAFDGCEVTSYHNNFKYYQADKNRGYTSHFGVEYQSSTPHDLVVIAFPKSKAELNFTLAMLASSIADDATIIVVGDNKSGIKSLAKLTSGVLNNVIKQDSARHCLLFSAQLIEPQFPFNLEDWFDDYQITVNSESISVAALPGVFSQKGLDKGTAVLLRHVKQRFSGKLLDFGCGAGVIAAAIGKQNPECQLVLADVSALALVSAEKTLEMNELSGSFIATDSLSHIVGKFEHIISNPPFHQGLKTFYQATEDFLAGVKSHMSKRADIYVIANSFLKYQPIMERAIGTTDVKVQENGFSLYYARSN